MKVFLKWLSVILLIDLSVSVANISVPIRWIVEPTDVILVRGTNVRVECKADGFPKPHVTWKISIGNASDEYVDLNFGTNIRIEDGTLCIDNIQKNNEGYYLCEAYNSIVTILKAPIMIIVGVPPIFIEQDRNQTAQLHESATLQCRVEGDKPILISWYSNHIPLNSLNQNGYTIHEYIESSAMVSHVIIKRTERTDTSLFTCVATNDFGSRNSSINMVIQEAPEIPFGLKVVGKTERSVKFSWVRPYDGNSPIKRYIIDLDRSRGIMEISIKRITVPGDTNEVDVELSPARTYQVRIMAENEIGVSDPSDSLTITTDEEILSDKLQAITVESSKQTALEITDTKIIDQPPTDISCTTLTSQTIRVSWTSPPLESANGVINGYKVFYARSELGSDDDENQVYKKTASNDTLLNGLKHYTDYKIQVLATTLGGDGVRSQAIYCQTEQDVPYAPTDVEALVITSEAILVSWQQPIQPNGIILRYTVYYKPEGSEAPPLRHRIISNRTQYEASGLENNKVYYFWVTASTVIGEGAASEVVLAKTKERVPSRIISLNEIFMINLKSQVKLPCRTIGSETPVVSWRINGNNFIPNDRIIQLADGSLFIDEVKQDDAGEYTCYIGNSLTNNSITHTIFLKEPLKPPTLILLGITTTSLTFKLEQHEADSEEIVGYVLHYKPEFGDWETVDVPVDMNIYTLENLYCGSRYQVFATSYNNVDTSKASDILNTSTIGLKPTIPNDSRFFTVQSNSVTLRMAAWKNGGCPILGIVVENKQKDQVEWDLVSKMVSGKSHLIINDLEPDTSYNLRVVFTNSAGSSIGEYEYST